MSDDSTEREKERERKWKYKYILRLGTVKTCFIYPNC